MKITRTEEDFHHKISGMTTALRAFHLAAKVPRPTGRSLGDNAGNKLRYTLLREENEEYFDAAFDGDMVEIADALTDCLYIVLGSFVHHGLDDKIVPLFWEVHRSNMTKFKGKQKVDPVTGKQLKSSEYEEPRIERILDA